MNDSDANGDLTRSYDEAAKLRVLRERARALAAAPPPEPPAGSDMEILAFSLGGSAYAIDIKWVREVSAVRDLVPLPCTPAFVAGVLNLRGEVITLIETKVFLDLELRGLYDSVEAIVVEGGGLTFGLLVGRVTGMRTLPVGEIRAVGGAAADRCAAYLMGATDSGVKVLDMARIVANPRLIVDEEVQHEPSQ